MKKIVYGVLRGIEYMGNVLGTLCHVFPRAVRIRLFYACGLVRRVMPATGVVYAAYFGFVYFFVRQCAHTGDLVERRFLNDFTMELDVSQKAQRQIFLTKLFAQHIAKLMERYVKEGDTAVDIGGNVGFFTLVLAKYVGVAGQVYVFEPEQDNIQKLNNNIKKNNKKHIHVYAGAVSDHVGETVLHRNPLNEGGHTLEDQAEFKDSAKVYSREEMEQKNKDFVFEQKTKMWSLDEEFEIWKKSGRVPSFVKIDVEGHELAVLRGGRRFFAEAKPKVVCEIGEDTEQEVVAIMESLGYTTYYIDLNGGLSRPSGRRATHDIFFM